METLKIVATVAGCVTAVSAALIVLRKVWKKIDAICEGQKSLLRSDMLRAYYHNQEAGQIRQYEYEAFMRSYTAYKALGGNSFIDKIESEIETWEVTT